MMRIHPPALTTPSLPRTPPCATFVAVRRWVARRLGGVGHEDAVAAAACTLFDLTRPIHRLGNPARRLLRLAAMAHDVGRCVNDEDHPAEGARMVAAEAALPLSRSERRGLAYLTLYHRGPVPELGADSVLHPNDDRAGLRLLLALLRAADALDCRKLPTPRLAFALGRNPTRVPGAARCLRVTCYLPGDSAKARRVFARRKKFRLLEGLLGLRVEVEIAVAEELRLAA